MSIDPNDFDEIVKRFDRLSREDRAVLIERLQRRSVAVGEVMPGQSESLFDALNKTGMAGSIKGTPPDWSSNPKYLEGFGKNGD